MIVDLDGRSIGDDYPCYVIAEIGINHNGQIDLVKQLIDVAFEAGCDAIKFQKRTPEICVPEEQWEIQRETPWGTMSYIEYKNKIEFGLKEYREIDSYCSKKGMTWFASPWDVPSVDFLEELEVPCYKVASACLTDDELLKHIRSKGRPVLLSTGMSSMEQIRRAVSYLDGENLIILQCNSSYPAVHEELNLRVIPSYSEEFGVPIGYSGHETGLAPSLAAVALGAKVIERHITLDRAMWGTDQAASVEPQGIERLVRDIRVVEACLGDGAKMVYQSEMEAMEKLRRVR